MPMGSNWSRGFSMRPNVPTQTIYYSCMAAEQAAYEETAVEDGDICTRMDRGRRALYEAGDNDAGPYQSPMEDAMIHFHEWVRKALGEPVSGSYADL